MLKYVLLATALMWASPAAADTEWTYVATTNGGTVIHARTSDLLKGRSHHTTAPVWVRMDASRDRTVSFREARVLYAVNCVARTSRSVQATVYFRNGTTQTDSVRAEEFIIPDSNLDTVANMLCSDPTPEPNYR
jgi:hypothetical protein